MEDRTFIFPDSPGYLIQKLKEENHLLKVERDSALQSQRDSFEEQDKQIQELTKQNLRLIAKEARSRGELTGTLEGILYWDIPEELRVKIQAQIKELRSNENLIK